jgi:hypothetical protein
MLVSSNSWRSNTPRLYVRQMQQELPGLFPDVYHLSEKLCEYEGKEMPPWNRNNFWLSANLSQRESVSIEVFRLQRHLCL